MGDHSAIEWCDASWNPVTGCSKVSPGCAHCYAERLAPKVFAGQTVVVQEGGGECSYRRREFTDVRTHAGRLDQPLRWRRPRRIFVNSMSDLFHEDVPDAFIDRVFETMAFAPRHTFQILTKRAERMRQLVPTLASKHTAQDGSGWPLPNVWLGVSVENQHFADERIPLLLDTPAAVRFISYEPAIGPVNLADCLFRYCDGCGIRADVCDTVRKRGGACCPDCRHRSVDWVIVGGESGPGARPFDLAWARSIVHQCQAAGVPVFVKQLGRVPVMADAIWRSLHPTPLLSARNHRRVTDDVVPLAFRNRKGGDIDEWPVDLRVREFPRVAVPA